MSKFIIGFVAGVASVIAAGFALCEVAEYCDLPMEEEDNE